MTRGLMQKQNPEEFISIFCPKRENTCAIKLIYQLMIANTEPQI